VRLAQHIAAAQTCCTAAFGDYVGASELLARNRDPKTSD
jgi:hypothetical protein